MADNKAKRGGSDRGLIALSEAYEVRYWSKKFKVTPAEIEGGSQGCRPLRQEGRSLYQAAKSQGE